MIKYCTVCRREELVEKAPTLDDTYTVECKKCGQYRVSKVLDDSMYKWGMPHTLSSWIYQENNNGIIPILRHEDYDRLENIPDKSLDDKYKLFLQLVLNDLEEYPHISFEQTDVNNDGFVTVPKYITASWCKNVQELNALYQEAIDNKHIVTHPRQHIITSITFKARTFLENIMGVSSNKIFMAFHFTDELKEQFETTIRRAVTDASENRLEAVRVSSSTTDHDTKIDDELIGMLKSSKAIIADFTGQRNAVYYEAGYAMGLGIPVIWTCRDTDADALSFDTRQYPHIIWKDEEDLYNQVVNRLKAKII